MDIKGFDKLIITYPPFDEIKRGKVIGIKTEKDNSTTFIMAPLGVHFGHIKSNRNAFNINSKDIDKKLVSIKIHKV